MKDVIKKYFEKAIETDEALKNVYDEKKLDACIKYIREQARKQAKNGCACIEDEVVYKWARDFMYGDIPAEEKPAEPVETVEEKKTEEPAETVLPLRICKTCGYCHEAFCQWYSAGIDNLEQPACENYARKATTEEVMAIKDEPLKIEKVIQKPKKSKKKEPEYDGPSLFDFDDLY